MLRTTPQMRQSEQGTTTRDRITDAAAASLDALIPAPAHAIGDAPSAAAFAAMQSAFQPSGGLLQADDLVCHWRERRRGNSVSLARMIAAGEVCNFEWQGAVWVPLFQFDSNDFSVKLPVRMVQKELGHALSGWALAAWFARPNAWLAEHRPADLVHIRPLKVLKAACGDRYSATR